MSTDVTAARSTKRRVRRLNLAIGLLAGAAILLTAGYTAAIAMAPSPAPEFELRGEAERTVEADHASAQAVVDAQSLPTAIGWADDDEVWTNDDTAYPLGSISKLITILLCMEKNPLEAGADGATYTWTAEDAARTEQYLAVDGVAYRIPVGTELTQREMLEFIFLPSANDYAHAYALWTFGSNEAFLEALEAFKQKHGLSSVNFVEPTGMDAENRANAADLVRVARLALANPTIREFNGMQTADMPWGVGTIENSNPLLGVMPGVIGTKTGTLDAVGYNFIVSQQADALGREVVNIAVTLARPSKPARADSGRQMLEAMATLPQSVEIVADGEPVGTVTTADGSEIPLVADGAASAVLVPGEEATRTAELLPLDPGDAGRTAGVIRVDTPAGPQEIPVVTGAAVPEPDFWWRLTHPAEVFG